MATSQRSFASRIDRGEVMYQRMLTFEGYEPGEQDLTIAYYRTLLDSVKGEYQNHSGTQYDFLGEAKKRAAAFGKGPDSLSKLATRIKTYTRAKFKKDSHEFQSVEKLVLKMRGQKPAVINRGANESTISQSETSYGAQLVNFEDIVEIAKGLDSRYTPANASIKLPQIIAAAQQASALNDSTAATYALFKPAVAKRQNAFIRLNEISTRIKDMVQSQYGTDSPEYKLIKGLNFSV